MTSFPSINYLSPSLSFSVLSSPRTPPNPNPLSRLHYFRPSLVSLLFPSTPIRFYIRFLYFPFFFPSLLFLFSIPPYLFPFTSFFSFSFVLFPFPPIPVFPSLYLPFSHFLLRFYVVVYSFAATYAFLSSLILWSAHNSL